MGYGGYVWYESNMNATCAIKKGDCKPICSHTLHHAAVVSTSDCLQVAAINPIIPKPTGAASFLQKWSETQGVTGNGVLLKAPSDIGNYIHSPKGCKQKMYPYMEV